MTDIDTKVHFTKKKTRWVRGRKFVRKAQQFNKTINTKIIFNTLIKNIFKKIYSL